MWWPTQARRPRATQNVFFSSAPQASSGRWAGTGSGSAVGHVAARAPDHRRAPHDGVVGARLDRPVVQQEQVGDARQALERVVVAERDRLVRDVAARHHERHAARRPAAGGGAASTAASRPARARPARRDGATAAPARRGTSTIGRAGLASSDSSSGVVSTSDRAAARSRTINANGRSSRCLRDRRAATAASSSARHARWNPPMPLTATIEPSTKPTRPRRAGHPEPRPRLPSSVFPNRQPRSTAGTRVRLRVIPPIRRILVLRPARAAHLEPRHRRQRPVVGDAAHDREPRAAVGAVDERVAVAPVGRVEQLAQAVVACRRVGSDGRVRAAARRARRDREARGPRRLGGLAPTTRSTRASGGASAATAR